MQVLVCQLTKLLSSHGQAKLPKAPAQDLSPACFTWAYTDGKFLTSEHLGGPAQHNVQKVATRSPPHTSPHGHLLSHFYPNAATHTLPTVCTNSSWSCFGMWDSDTLVSPSWHSIYAHPVPPYTQAQPSSLVNRQDSCLQNGYKNQM